MTTQQLYLFSWLALVLTTVVAVVTRATFRRIAAALAGAAACGPVALGVVTLCERAGWWHMAMPDDPYILMLLWVSFALCGYAFLITWRIARRFGRRGLAVAVCVVVILGPLRDSWYMARFPEWGYYAPGLGPMLAISAAYVLLGGVFQEFFDDRLEVGERTDARQGRHIGRTTVAAQAGQRQDAVGKDLIRPCPAPGQQFGCLLQS